MRRFLRIRTFFAMTIVFVLASSASAHHIWIDREGNEFVVRRGMFSERLDAYDTSCVKEVKAYGKNGNVLFITRNDKPDHVRFSASAAPAMAIAESEWGYRVMTTEGKKFLTRKQALSKGLAVINAFFSIQFAKTIFSSDCPIGQPVGQKFELVPLQNPLASSTGNSLQVRLLYDGKPLPRTQIFGSDGKKWTTDQDGLAHISLPKGKSFLIYSKHWVEANNRKDIDRIVYRTFLTAGSD